MKDATYKSGLVLYFVVWSRRLVLYFVAWCRSDVVNLVLGFLLLRFFSFLMNGENSILLKSLLYMIFCLIRQRFLLTCQANSVVLGRFFFCTGQQQLCRVQQNFKIKYSRPLFTIIFTTKIVFLDTDSILRVKSMYDSVK